VWESKNYLKFSLSQKIITLLFWSPTQLFEVPLDPPLTLYVCLLLLKFEYVHVFIRNYYLDSCDIKHFFELV